MQVTTNTFARSLGVSNADDSIWESREVLVQHGLCRRHGSRDQQGLPQNSALQGSCISLGGELRLWPQVSRADYFDVCIPSFT